MVNIWVNLNTHSVKDHSNLVSKVKTGEIWKHSKYGIPIAHKVEAVDSGTKASSNPCTTQEDGKIAINFGLWSIYKTFQR